MEKELFRLVVLPCFDLCRSKSFHVRVLIEKVTKKIFSIIMNIIIVEIQFIVFWCVYLLANASKCLPIPMTHDRYTE